MLLSIVRLVDQLVANLNVFLVLLVHFCFFVPTLVSVCSDRTLFVHNEMRSSLFRQLKFQKTSLLLSHSLYVLLMTVSYLSLFEQCLM